MDRKQLFGQVHSQGAFWIFAEKRLIFNFTIFTRSGVRDHPGNFIANFRILEPKKKSNLPSKFLFRYCISLIDNLYQF